ncbi:flagellar filament capping protein FliD [Blastococcus sp. SYSU DS0973]
MTVDGLVSGLDTTSLINQLIQAEAAPQTALRNRLTSTESAASAYRSINTRFDALRTAAEAVLKPETWSSAKASSSAPSVSVALGSAPQTGSLTFDVKAVAVTHSVVSTASWTASTQPYGLASPIVVRDALDQPKGEIALPADATLEDAVKAINAASFGLSATAVRVGDNDYRLQVTAKTSGVSTTFGLGGATEFSTTTQGADAHITVGSTAAAYDVRSATNDFTGLVPGATITVSKPESGVTVAVGSNPEAIAAKVQALVDAANSALGSISLYGSSTGGSIAVLKGDSTLTSMAGQVLRIASSGAGGTGSAAPVGIQLTRNGSVTFDKATFLAAYARDPAMVEGTIVGTPAGPGPDNTINTADDGMPGLARGLQTFTKSATNTTTGTLTTLAKSRDDLVKDIQDRIDAWDLRLEKRREALTRQFTAMETALSTMKQQSSWLAGQISSLPSYG